MRWREGEGGSGRDGERNEGERENGRERKEIEGRKGGEKVKHSSAEIIG